jgi:hypothetical protein
VFSYPTFLIFVQGEITMLINKCVSIIISLFIICISIQAMAAPPPPEFIQFRPSATKGALYYPDPAQFPNPHIGVIAIHRDGNFMSHIMTRELPKRGFVALGMNTRCDNNEAMCAPWEDNALDVKQGIEYLRKLPRITHVILFGHSGGGPTMSFYQAVAETGASFCQQAEKLMKCSDQLNDLPQADALILWDSHPGNGLGVMRSLNAAIINDADIINHHVAPKFDPALDPFNPEYGYNPEGSTYTENFKERFFIGQAARMNRLIDIAQDKMIQMEKGTYIYSDNDAFIVPAVAGTRLANHDASIDHTTIRPQQLLRNDGSIEECCTVESVRHVGQSPDTSRGFNGVGFSTLKSFLSVNAIRGTHSMTQIDWCTSNNSTTCNVRQISAPLLVVAMGGHYFLRDGEIIFDNAVSKDREYIIIEGAVHGGTPCTRCMPSGQPYDGRYDNSVKNNFDYLANWINTRF